VHFSNTTLIVFKIRMLDLSKITPAKQVKVLDGHLNLIENKMASLIMSIQCNDKFQMINNSKMQIKC